MKIIDRIKAAFTTDKPSRYEAASTATLIGRNYVPPPFNYHAAVIECRSWIYAAARLNAIAVASAPLRLYVRRREGAKRLWNTRRTGRRTKAYLSGDLGQHPSRYAMTKAAEFGDDYEIVTDAHPLLELLSKVNPYQNGFDATVLRVLYAELTGNAYLHPVIDPALNVPVELWTMPPQWVKIVPGNPLRDEPWIKAYEYGRNDAQRQDFAPDEVIHFKYPNPRDLYYGLGKVEAAWGAVTSNQALHEMDYHFFANKSRPDYLLVTKGNASDEELERFTAQVETKLRGTNKTGRFLAITGDVDLKPLQFPPKDLQGREEIVEEIAAVFGVPVSMLRANDPNLASATVGFATWKETTILPMLRMDEEVLNQNLVPLFGIEGDAFLAYDNPVRADESSETSKRISYVQGGILTANEAREQEGLEPIANENANRLLINGQPLGGQPLPMFGAAPAAPAAPVVETPDVADVAPVPGEAIADTALNGAQVTSLVDLATAVGVGQLPKDTAIAIAGAAFPAIAPDQIRAMFDPIKPSSQPAAVPAATPEVAPEVAPKAVQRKDALSDCVSDKIRKLLDEGYEQEQAVAIAYSMCSGNGLEESIGKAVSDINTKPPASVAANAQRALDVREIKDCGTGAGGFKPGNDCARQGGGSENAESNLVSKIQSAAEERVASVEIRSDMTRDEFYDAQDQIVEALTQTVGDWADISDQFRPERLPFERASTGSGYVDVVADNAKVMRVRISDHMEAYAPRGDVDLQISISPNEASPKQAMRRVVQFLNANRDEETLEYSDKKSCGCGCGKTKTVKQSDFISKHNDASNDGGFGAWLKTKNAEREAAKIAKREAEAAARLSKVFDKQVSDLLVALAAAERPTVELIQQAERIIRNRATQRAVVEALTPYIREAIETGITIGVETVEKIAPQVDFEAERADLAKYAETESVRLSRRTAQGVIETQTEKVRTVLGDGLEKGENIDQLATRVQEWADKQKDQDGSWSRATTIARTESMRAARSAELEAWESTGLVTGKTWLLAPDPCEFCEAVSKSFESKSVGLRDTFYKKGDVLTGADGGRMVLDFEDVTAPPLHPNCRCSMIPKLVSELDEITREIEDSGALARAQAEVNAEDAKR